MNNSSWDFLRIQHGNILAVSVAIEMIMFSIIFPLLLDKWIYSIEKDKLLPSKVFSFVLDNWATIVGKCNRSTPQAKTQV
jgi:hypothetical protein